NQTAENRWKFADCRAMVGIPIDRVGSTEIEAVARRMGTLPAPGSIETAAIRSALENKLVSPADVDSIYGRGAADAIRSTSTPANGAVDPAQSSAIQRPA